jgi:hypothetical protein
VQGYNAQAATNDQHIVIAAELNADSPDFGHLQPMVDAAQAELAAIGICQTPSVVLADAGDWRQDQMQNIIDRGIQVLIPPDAVLAGGGPGRFVRLRRFGSSGTRGRALLFHS